MGSKYVLVSLVTTIPSMDKLLQAGEEVVLGFWWENFTPYVL